MQQYVRAASVGHALELLRDSEGAVLVAGGQTVLLQRPQPRLLVDIGRLDALRQLHTENGELVLGPLVRLDRLARSALVAEHAPLLAHCAAGMGDPQLRHQATLGGALCGVPDGELVAAAVTLDAVIGVRTPTGAETVTMKQFLSRRDRPTRPAAEIVTDIRIPCPGGRWGYAKLTRRSWGRPDMIAATAQGRITIVDAPCAPLRAAAAEAALAATGDRTHAIALVPDLITPGGPPRTPLDYRRQLAAVLTDRALKQAGW
ncbi:xanthine dehydrogenase family protein subunit M [Streptomyces sp. SAS_267]|uniref:FAD binding domain-containing protein n=1 Tax=unclassified Streptomyces TaxID=2593676 RepID=UPI0036F6BFF5